MTRTPRRRRIRLAAGTDDLTAKTLSGLFLSSTGSVTVFVLQILVTAILARLLSPTDFGLVSAAGVVIALANLFVQVGIGPALIQREVVEQHHLDTSFTLSLLLAAGLTLGLLLGAPWIADWFRMPALVPVLRVLSLGFVIQGPMVVASSIMHRKMRFGVIAASSILSYLIGYGIVGVGLALAGAGVWALVGATLAQIATAVAFALVAERVPVRFSVKLTGARELLRFGGGYTAAGVGSYLADNADNVVVGRVLGAEALGFYGRAFQFLSVPSQLAGSVLDKVFFPVLSRVQSQRERLGSAYRRSLATIALAVLPMTVLMVVLAPEIVHVLLGSRWDAVILPFQILALAMLPRVSGKMAKAVAKATGAVYGSAWRQFLFAGLLLVSTAAGSRWGLPGVAVGVAAATTANYLIMLQFSLKMSGLRWSDAVRAHRSGVLMGATLLAMAWPLAALARHKGLPDLATMTLVGGVPVACLVFCSHWWPSVFLGRDGVWAIRLIRGLPDEASPV